MGIPKGGLDNDEEIDLEEVYKPFHGQAPSEELERGGGQEERLVQALDLNGGIKIEVVDFFGKMHAEDYTWIGKQVWRIILSGNPWPRIGRYFS